MNLPKLFLSAIPLVAISLVGFACGSDSNSSNPTPCELDNAPAECSEPCSGTDPCATGFYCGAGGTCTADCALGGSNCGGDATCTSDGKCVPNDQLPDGGSGTGSQCSDGIDNDGDGAIDGADPECTGSEDNDEGSFATGIPGDNIDAVKQDCFYDGNSGAGDDGCDIHVCCLLSPGDAAGCPAEFKPDQYDPNNCEQTQLCKDTCGALTPVGCDCFGCCSVCNDEGCFDILTNPNVSPGCTAEDAHNPDICVSCTKSVDCGPDDDCVSLECQLCPGEELPPECEGMNECATGQTSCVVDEDCGGDGYCSNSCCVSIIN